MTTPLRIGFLVSGALHMAVVAAFSLPTPSAVPVAHEALPITLKLAVFQPPAEPVAAARPATPSPVVAEPPPATPPPEPVSREPEPRAAAEPVIAPSEPEPRVAVKAVPPVKTAVADKPRPRLPERPRQAAVREPAAVRPDPPPEPAVRPSAVPPVAAKAEASKPAVQPVGVQETQHYLAALAARIDRSKFYPRASRRLGEEGMTLVGFVIQRNGELTDIHVVESSGHRRLDEAALKTLRRVTPFERIPDAIDRERWPITVPIAFSLRG